jgi:excisionase family DNA binding protein
MALDGERLTYSLSEVGRLLGLGRNSVYAAVKNGELPTLRIGRRLLVPKAKLDRLLTGTKAVSRGQTRR